MGTTLTVPARYIVTELLNLPPQSPLRRYIFIILVFQLSGLVHVVGDVAAGLRVKDSGVMQWFSMQALGFAIEDGAAALFGWITGQESNPDALWKKFVGFVWVCVWIVWSMPVWTYPISRASEGEGILPFSLIGRFLD